MSYETGACEMVITVLQGGLADKHSFILFSDLKNNFDHEALEIIEDVACYLAPAMSIIMVNEEMQRKEKEKAILLPLGHDLADVNSKGDLVCIIKRKVSSHFNAVNFVVSIISEDRQSHSVFIRKDQTGKTGGDRIEFAGKENYIINDDIFDRVAHSQEPLTFSLARLKKMTKAPGYIFLYDNKKGDKLIGARLKRAKQSSGAYGYRPA